MTKAGDSAFLRQRRPTSILLEFETVTVNIRDQQPLYSANVRFEGGWSFEDVIQAINEMVYFWPGKEDGPIAYGRRHFERYASERPSVIRVSTADLYRENAGVYPFYCRYNSGSPRCSNGLGSPRGPNTFVRSTATDYAPSKVVEVTYLAEVKLPPLVSVADTVVGPWRKL
jgi:hypothetical protein